MATTRRGADSNLAARELGFLVRLAQAAASTQKPDELLALIIGEATSAMGTDVCSLYLLLPSGRELLLTATNGLNENMVGKVKMRVGEGITGWVAETRQPAIVADVSQEPHWKWVPGLDEDRFHSMLSVPIESGPRLVGVLNAQAAERREFIAGDIDFLRAIAGQVAGILERSELQRRMEAQLAEIQLSHDIHERFTKLSLEGAGIRSILEAVGSLAGGPAALYSTDGYRVRGMGEAADGMPTRIHLPGAPSQAAFEVRITAGRPARPIDVVPVRAGGELLGLLAVGLDADGGDAPGRLRALEHGSTVLALELSKERAAAEVERRLRGDLVEEVLAGGLEADEAERIARQAERLGHRLPHRAWVVVLEPDDDATEAGLAAPGRADRLDGALSGLIRSRMPGAITLVRSASAVFLIPDEVASDLAAAEKLAGKSLQFKSVVFAGDGTPPGALRNVRVVGATPHTLIAEPVGAAASRPTGRSEHSGCCSRYRARKPCGDLSRSCSVRFSGTRSRATRPCWRRWRPCRPRGGCAARRHASWASTSTRCHTGWSASRRSPGSRWTIPRRGWRSASRCVRERCWACSG